MSRAQILLRRLAPEELTILERHQNAPPVKVSRIAGDLGIPTSVASFLPNISGQLRRTDNTPSGFQIRVSRSEGRERQRFTIAHELAHYFLHRDLIKHEISDNILLRSGLSDRLEVEANALGAYIIMPDKLLRANVAHEPEGLSRTEVERLASIFQVSFDAMRIRLGFRDD